MPPAEPIVRFRNVRKQIAGGGALSGVSFDVAHGAFFCLLGPAGAGKSTTLALLRGSAATEGGEILLDGQAARPGVLRRAVGSAPGKPLFPFLSVARTLRWSRARGSGRGDRMEEVIDRLGLRGITSRWIGELSPAQRYRVALARALAAAPAILAIDEMAEAEAALDALKSLQPALGLTVVLATRRPALAFALADRVAVFAAGMLHQVGAPESVYESPANAAVAAISGEVNRLAGTVAGLEEEDDLVIVKLEGGPIIHARPVGVAVGESCIVCIRPERIAIAASDAASMGEAALPATVRDARYQGDHVRLLVELEGGAARLVVRRPVIAGTAGLAPGADVAIAWQPAHARAFPRPAGGV